MSVEAFSEAVNRKAAEETSRWEEPTPLYAEHEKTEPYPIDALTPIIRGAVQSYQAFGQQPVEMVACSALSASSLACQGLADVDRDGNLRSPCSLSILSIAISGERKTSCDRRMRREIERWQRAKEEEQAPQIEGAERRFAIWQAEREGMVSKIKRLAGALDTKKSDERDQLKSKLILHDQDRPKIPVGVKLFYQDVTPERLASALATGWPSASLWSDEAGLIVGSHAMGEDSALRFLALLNIFWDGGTFDRQRETRACVHVRGRRFTSALMMQPNTLARLVATGEGLARGVGALGRFLLAWPTSTMGTRTYRPGHLDSPELVAFDRRIRELLETPLPVNDKGELEPPCLRLSPGAFEVWRAFHDAVEKEIGRAGEFSELSDFAAKAADQSTRIACVLHILEHGPTGEIDPDLMVAGGKIAGWHLTEARRIFSIIGQGGELSDAQLLLDWLLEQSESPKLGNILRLGPFRLRDKNRRDAAVAILSEHGLARKEIRERTEYLVLNPNTKERSHEQ
jgi:putative DNA primase/helicase